MLQADSLLGAKAGEVGLVDSRASSSAAGSGAAATTTAAATNTAATNTTTTTASAAAAATTGPVGAAGGLDEAHVNLEEVLLLALLLTLGLLLALDVLVGLLVALQLLGVGPLLVALVALVGGTNGLSAEVALRRPLSLVSGERLGHVGRLFGLLAGGLRLVLVVAGDGLTGSFVIPLLLAAGADAPCLVDLLASVPENCQLALP